MSESSNLKDKFTALLSVIVLSNAILKTEDAKDKDRLASGIATVRAPGAKGLHVHVHVRVPLASTTFAVSAVSLFGK